jgi:Family of unknown function (DUF6636)
MGRTSSTLGRVRRLTLLSVFLLAAHQGSAAAGRLPGLQSPSGNIRCLYAATTDARNNGGLFCTLGTASYARALQDRCLSANGQHGSGVDWHGFTLGAQGRGEVVCSGGALWFGSPRYAVLAYGRSRSLGPYTCTSRRTGLTCTNGHRHRLFLSRESWRVW